MPRIWFLHFPIELPITVSQNGERVLAEFQALPGSIGEGESMDEAILNLAKSIQAMLEKPHEHDPKRAA